MDKTGEFDFKKMDHGSKAKAIEVALDFEF